VKVHKLLLSLVSDVFQQVFYGTLASGNKEKWQRTKTFD
jgi:hypothetical protein